MYEEEILHKWCYDKNFSKQFDEGRFTTECCMTNFTLSITCLMENVSNLCDYIIGYNNDGGKGLQRVEGPKSGHSCTNALRHRWT